MQSNRCRRRRTDGIGGDKGGETWRKGDAKTTCGHLSSVECLKPKPFPSHPRRCNHMSVCLLASVFNGLLELTASIILFPGGRGRPILQLWTHVCTVGGGVETQDTRCCLWLHSWEGLRGSHQASLFQLFAGRAEGGMDISSVQRLYGTRMRIAAPESEVFICWRGGGGLLLLIIIF